MTDEEKLALQLLHSRPLVMRAVVTDGESSEDFLTRIRRLQGQQKAAEYQAARAKGKRDSRATHAKAGPGMVLSVRVDPARITLSRLRFMGEEPNYAPDLGSSAQGDACSSGGQVDAGDT